MKAIAYKASFALLVLWSVFAPIGSVSAQAGATKPSAEQEDGPSWSQLSPQQRANLAPIQAQWQGMAGSTKEKWLVLSRRMVNMKADERDRIQSRMSQWANLTPVERGQARLQFNQARRVAPDARAERWKLYNELSEDERRQLAARAVPPEATRSVSAVGRKMPSTRQDASQQSGKVNITPVAPSVQPQRVTPSVVQAQPGASTSLITTRPSPPPHQPAGQPKIAPASKPVPLIEATPRSAPEAAPIPEPDLRP
jgi:hypothetical protein